MSDTIHNRYLQSAIGQDPEIEIPGAVFVQTNAATILQRGWSLIIDFFFLFLVLAIIIFALQAMMGLNIFLLGEDSALGGWIVAIWILTWMVLRTGYYVGFEYLMKGETLGKRMVGIRVEKLNGLPPDLWQVFVRNLLRSVDAIPYGYGVGILCHIISPHGQRLGDIAAGTTVRPSKIPKSTTTVTDVLPSGEEGRTGGFSMDSWLLLCRYMNWATRTLPDVDRTQVAQKVWIRIFENMDPSSKEQWKDLTGLSPDEALHRLYNGLRNEIG